MALFTNAGPARYKPDPSVISSLSQRTGKISPPGHAVAHDRGDLADSGGGDDGVVAKDSAEIVFVGKDVFLQRQKDAGRIDQIDQRQPVLHGDPLGPEDFFGGGRKKGAGFHRGVVGDDHVPAAGHQAHPADDPGRGCPAPLGIHLPRRPETDFEPKAAWVQRQADPLAGGEPPFGVLTLDRGRATPQPDFFGVGRQLLGEAGQRRTRMLGTHCFWPKMFVGGELTSTAHVGHRLAGRSIGTGHILAVTERNRHAGSARRGFIQEGNGW